jgi:hypothetical protein
MRTAYYNFPLVAEVKLRIVWREFFHSVRTTLEGKFAVVTLLAAPFMMKSMLVASALQQAGLSEDTLWAFLWIAHLSMMATTVLFVAARTSRSLVVERREDALAQYPHARQGLAAIHLWGELVAFVTLMLLAVFYFFYGSLVHMLARDGLTGTLLHVVGHAAVTLAVGATSYGLTVRALESRPRWGRRIYNLTSYSGAFAFVMIAGGSHFLLGFAPDRVDELRSMFDGAGRFYPPVAALLGSMERPGPWLGWLVGVALAGAIARAAAAPFVQTPSILLLGEVQDAVDRRFMSVFGGRKRLSTHRVVHVTRMFFLKDVFLAAVRSPQGFFRRQAAFIGMVSLAPYLGWGLRQEGLIGGNEAEALVVGLLVALVCIAAYRGGLGALGTEGSALALLRSIVRPIDLMGYKTFAVLAAVIPAGLLYGACAGVLSHALDMRPGPVAATGVGGLTAVVAATFAVALSFFFPDFERRNVFVPGSSHLGRLAFTSIALYGAGIVAALRWTTRTGVVPSNMFLPGLMTAAGFGIALTGLVVILALRRFPHLES